MFFVAGTAQSGLLSSLNSTLILTAVIVLGIVAVSVAPAFIGVIKAALNSRRAKEGDPVAQAAERVNEAEYERELTEERVMRAEAEAKAEARRRVAAEDAQAASETEEKGGE